MKISTRDARKISEHMTSHTDFDTHGSLSGRAGRFTTWDAGRLPTEYVEDFVGSAYAVFSYATPIAWLSAGEWVVPDVRYSLTTTRQQFTIRGALAFVSAVAA